jgi:hypothetical protein
VSHPPRDPPPNPASDQPAASEPARLSQELQLRAPEVFLSALDKPLSPKERIEKIEAILKLLGLPNLDEFNRQEREAEASAKRRRSKDSPV